MNDCIEQIMDDIVRIDFYDATETTIARSVPFAVAGVVAMTVQQGATDLSRNVGTPVLSLNAAGGTDIGALMEPPTHKSQSTREAIGDVYQHTLEIPVETGFDDAEQAAYTLSGKEILAVLTAYNGSKLCVHYLPDSTKLTYSDQRGSSHTGTLKYEAESLSGLVSIVAVTVS